MRLTSLEILNFRGIHEANLRFPHSKRLLCIIGAGDSCKTTLLKAIEWCLWPSYSLLATDSDFYNCDTSNPILIRASIAEIPEELTREEKYGLYLRDSDSVLSGLENDEPTDTGVPVITIQLAIDENLEPNWSVITNRSDSKPITQKDRRLLAFGVIGTDFDKDFQWGKNSVLQRYSNSSRDSLHSAYTQAMRLAVANTDLSDLDSMAGKLTEIGRKYGVSFNGVLHNRLLMQNGSYSSNVGVYDDNVPFVQRGLGSKRLFSMGMNISVSEGVSLILIDEVETGLEPYRICTLINELRNVSKTKGQIIMTTHSRSTICECNAEELLVMNCSNGIAKLQAFEDLTIKSSIQGMLRANPDAFLCKRLIVCEGKTEIGVLRACDSYLDNSSNVKFAHFGTSTALGNGGNSTFKLARVLKEYGYDVCILMDSDRDDEIAEKKALESEGIAVFSWDPGYSIEEQIFHDATSDVAEKMIMAAVEIKSFDHVCAKMSGAFPDTKPYTIEGNSIKLNTPVTEETLVRIGKIAKSEAWFKRIDFGQQIGEIIFDEYDEFVGKTFRCVIERLLQWVMSNETQGN